MAIKKALYGRQPDVFVLFMFSFVLLLLQLVFLLCPCCSKIVCFSLFSVVSNKVPSFTHLRCFKVVIHMRSCRFLHASV